jgi:hypothetical protein
MVEPVSAALAGAYATKQAGAAIARLLGPSADEVADALSRYTAKKLENVGRVVANADSKSSGQGRNTRPSGISRV